MPNLYYSRLFDIGEGKFLGMIFVDSCFSMCTSYNYANGTGGQLLMASPEMKKLRDYQCGDPTVTAMADQMFAWMTKTMDEWDANENIVWKATAQHHPLFGKWYHDYEHLVANNLPLMLQHRFDFYFNGHEHTLEHAFFPYDQVPHLLREQEE